MYSYGHHDKCEKWLVAFIHTAQMMGDIERFSFTYWSFCRSSSDMSRHGFAHFKLIVSFLVVEFCWKSGFKNGISQILNIDYN